MAVVSSDLIAAANRGFRALFNEGFNRANPVVDKLATTFVSTGADENYTWLSDVPAVREWLDERQPGGMKASSFLVANRDWEASVAVDRNTFEDDKLGMISPRVRSLGEACRMHPDELLFTILGNLNTGSYTAYDGMYIACASHLDPGMAAGSIQSNVIASGNGVGSAGPILVDLAAARARMRRFYGWRANDGLSQLRLVGDVIICPPEAEGYFAQAANASVLANDDNVIGRQFIKEIIVAEELADTNNWILACTNRELKPFIFQSRKWPPEFVSRTKSDDPDVFNKRSFLFGADARYAIANARWQQLVLVVNSG